MIVFASLAALIAVIAGLFIARPLAREKHGAPIALVTTGAIALAAFMIYFPGAEPGEPGQPHSATVARLIEADPATLTLEEQEERLRALVRREPDNTQALAMLGRLLAATERELEAVSVLERALRIEESARTLSDLGQTLVTLNEGEVTPAASRAFERAYELDPALPEPAFFLGLRAYQDGDREAAARYWGAIIAQLEPGDPFRGAIAARAADLLSRPSAGPALGAEGEAAGEAPFADLDPGEAEAMVAAMVDRLQARLDENPDDFSGWMTLVRARATSGQREAALASLAQAQSNFDSEPRRVMLSALARALGLVPVSGAQQDEETR